MYRPDDPGNRLGSMPLTVQRVALVFERPFVDAGREGSTVDTSLRGALFEGLLPLACPRDGACALSDEGHPCVDRGNCALGWLYQVHCPHQNRDHRSPIGVAIDTGAAASGAEWSAVLRCWGDRACALEALIVHGLEEAGRRGLNSATGPVRFQCRWRVPERGVLAQHCRLPNPVPERAELRFVTPCQSPAADLDSLLGNAAHHLMQWRLVDTGESASLGKLGCDTIADVVGAEAAESLAGAVVHWSEQGVASIGSRRSRTNQGRFILRGFTGRIVLSGSLAGCWPWLAMLAARGAGGRTGFGMGRVELSAAE